MADILYSAFGLDEPIKADLDRTHFPALTPMFDKTPILFLQAVGAGPNFSE